MIRFMLTFVLMLCGAAYAGPMPVTTEGQNPSYSYQAADITPAATATDVVCLVGSASKTVYVNRVQITADATGSAVLDLYVFKRTAANTGGTATQPAFVKHDSADPAATGVINLYSANPTGLGAGVVLAGDHYMIPATQGTQYFFSSPWIEDFGQNGAKRIALRGSAEQLCVSLNGQTLPAGTSLYVRIEWSEGI